MVMHRTGFTNVKEMKEAYHAFIMTKDRRFFSGAAIKQNKTDFTVYVDRTLHPTYSEPKLLSEMTDVLVDFTREVGHGEV